MHKGAARFVYFHYLRPLILYFGKPLFRDIIVRNVVLFLCFASVLMHPLSVGVFYAVYLVLLSGIKHKLSPSLLGFTINLKEPALFSFFQKCTSSDSGESSTCARSHTN